MPKLYHKPPTTTASDGKSLQEETKVVPSETSDLVYKLGDLLAEHDVPEGLQEMIIDLIEGWEVRGY